MIRQARIDKHEELTDRYGGSKQLIYKKLKAQGFFLPPLSCTAVTREYLLGIQEGYIQAVSFDPDVKYVGRKVDRYVAFCILLECCDLPVGFNITQLPPKSWMLDFACMVKPEHPEFVSQQRLQQIKRLIETDTTHAGMIFVELNNLPTALELKQKYRPDIKLYFQLAVKDRLDELKAAHSFITINKQHQLLN